VVKVLAFRQARFLTSALDTPLAAILQFQLSQGMQIPGKPPARAFGLDSQGLCLG
jgi:hypothetical protein